MSDWQDIEAAEREMIVAQQALKDMAAKAAIAQQVVDFAKRRADSALSEYAVLYLNDGAGTGEAEHRAQADKRYKESMKLIMRETASADQILREWDNADKRWRSAQSILSARRAIAGAGI